MSKIILKKDSKEAKIYIIILIVVALGYGAVVANMYYMYRNNVKTSIDNYDVDKLSYEEKYKVQCGPRQNYEIISAYNPEFYFDEQISVVGKVVGIEDNSTYNSKSGHIDTSMNHTILNKNTDLIYHISDEGLSDGGGIWKFRSVDNSFKVGDMIIIYGTGAIAQHDPDSVLLTVKYADFYKE